MLMKQHLILFFNFLIAFLIFSCKEDPNRHLNLGNWYLQNDDQYLVFTDYSTNLEQVYDIISLTENTIYMKGVINLSTDALDLGGDMGILELLGSDFELPISIDLYLERVS